MPFGGGSGGGVSITPIAFLVVNSAGVKVVPLDNQTHLYERLIDSAPQVFDKIQSMMKGNKNSSNGLGATQGSTPDPFVSSNSTQTNTPNNSTGYN